MSGIDSSGFSQPFQENETLCDQPELAGSRSPSQQVGQASSPYGIDIQQGLRYAGGKLPLYHKLASLFLETHGCEFTPQFEISFASDDWKNTMRLAHTLKSAARMIGATTLGAQAETLETACLAKEKTMASIIFNELKLELEKICTDLPVFIGKL